MILYRTVESRVVCRQDTEEWRLIFTTEFACSEFKARIARNRYELSLVFDINIYIYIFECTRCTIQLMLSNSTKIKFCQGYNNLARRTVNRIPCQRVVSTKISLIIRKMSLFAAKILNWTKVKVSIWIRFLLLNYSYLMDCILIALSRKTLNWYYGTYSRNSAHLSRSCSHDIN